MFRTPRSFPALVATLFVGLAGGLVAAASPATAATVRPKGYDVSYPQCTGPLPVGGDFGVIGVDGGRPFDPNPCLAEQIGWARGMARPQYYANTANPGPRLSAHWPIGQRWPRPCTSARPDSTDCAFDYGFDVAKSSFARARAAARAVGGRDVADSVWWLDVELHNTWESLEYGESPTYLRNDTAMLAGMVRLLHKRGVRTVGVYSTAHQWLRITGGARLDRAPVWYAGTGTLRTARSRCGPAYSFTGGPVRMTQYLQNGFDRDLRC